MEYALLTIKYPIANQEEFKIGAEILHNNYDKKVLYINNSRLYVNKQKDFYPLERIPEQWLKIIGTNVLSDELYLHNWRLDMADFLLRQADQNIISHAEFIKLMKSMTELMETSYGT